MNTNNTESQTAYQPVGSDSDGALEALANAISMQIEDTDAEVVKKKAPRDYQQELAKLKSEMKQAQNKIAQLEIDKRLALEKIPECLKQAATFFKGELFYTVQFLADNSGGMYEMHSVMDAVKRRALAVKNGKLHIQR